MKKKLFGTALIFSLIVTVISVLFCLNVTEEKSNDKNRMRIINLNEIKKLSENAYKNNDFESYQKLNIAIENMQDDLSKNSDSSLIKNTKGTIIFINCLAVMFIFIVFGYLYFAILRPFDKMKKYTDNIAMGNLDISLDYQRSNYFGEYTWAFDHMRKEIIKARSCEKVAIINNKTVIATLSHDIKTPIASIRAFAEGLEANLDTDINKRNKYISVILRKCDEVTKLTNDLFLHSLSDLDKLKMNFEKTNIKNIIIKVKNDMTEQAEDITIKNDIPDCELSIDSKRFEQALGNIINNSCKYAKSPIEINCEIKENNYVIHIKDFGHGILDDDMPFIFGKFYRGKNAGQKEGSGLGLYIVKYIMEQHGGEIALYNHCDGLEAVLKLPLNKK